MSESEPDHTSAVGFATRLLEELAMHRTPLSSSELGQKLGATPSRISRTLATLRKLGWVRRHSATRRYDLGWRAAQMGQYASGSLPLSEAALTPVSNLTKQVGNRILLSIPANLDAIVIISAASDVETPRIRTGAKLMFPRSPTTIALYAFRRQKYAGLDAEVVRMVEDDPGEYRDYQEFSDHIAQVREERIAYSVDVKQDGRGAIAIPIFSLEQAVAGALSMMIDKNDFTTANLKQMSGLLANCAAEIEHNLRTIQLYREENPERPVPKLPGTEIRHLRAVRK